jgi:hypothetical protein
MYLIKYKTLGFGVDKYSNKYYTMVTVYMIKYKSGGKNEEFGILFGKPWQVSGPVPPGPGPGRSPKSATRRLVQQVRGGGLPPGATALRPLPPGHGKEYL